MDLEKRDDYYKSAWTLIIILIFFLCLGTVVPLTGDDWTWGSQIGIRRLTTGFVGYNGRLFSNTLEILITRLSYMRIPIYALVNTLLVYLSVKITIPNKKATSWHFLFATGLYLTISTQVFSQSFGWFAGFINYIFGMLLIFIYIYWLVKDFKENAKSNPVYYFGLFMLGLLSALVIEHVTFYLWCLALGSIFYLNKNRKKLLLNCSYILGLVIGSAVMFLNPVYIRIFTGQDSFRHTADNGLIHQAINMYTNQMAKYVFQQNGLLLLALSISLIVLMYKNDFGNTILKWLTSFTLLSYSFFAAFIRNLFPSSNFNTTTINQLLAIFSIIYVLALIISVVFFIQNDGLNKRLGFYIVSAVLLSAPFVAITPYGPRCAFNTIAFIIIATLDTVNVIFASNPSREAIHIVNFYGIFSMIFILSIMGLNGYVYHSRAQVIRQQLAKKESTIYVRKLPFEQFVWDSSPSPSRFQYSMYKKRMHISNKQKLVFVSFDKWNKDKFIK